MLRRHPVLAPVTLIYLVVVAWATLTPQPNDDHHLAWVLRGLHAVTRIVEPRWPRLAELLSYSHVEFAANIAMFIPIGVFLVLLLGRRLWWLAILLCVMLTGAIEAAQNLIPGRVPDVRDLVSNSLGGVLGVLVALVITIPAYRRERDRDRIRELEAELDRYRGIV